MLPRVKITFENGALGQVAASTDGVMGLLCTGVTVGETFVLGTAYVVRSLADLAALGVTKINNPPILEYFMDFYAEAEEGTEHWLMAFPNTIKTDVMLDPSETNYAKALLLAANGRINGLVAQWTPDAGYTPVTTDGMDSLVLSAAMRAQGLATWAAGTMAAPIFVCLEGYAYTGVPGGLADLHTYSYNNVMIFVGHKLPDAKRASMGMLAGRIASQPIQRNIGRVKTGPLNTTAAYIKSQPVETADVTSLHDKGFVTLRTFPRRAGYFFSDDWMATKETDDYSHLTARRTINKAFRIAYDTLSEELLESIYVNQDGTMQLPIIKSYEALVENAIAASMTANGELSADITNPNDKGVQCFIDPTQNIVSSSRLVINVRVRPFGYARYIDVPLGFQVVNS